MNLTDAIVSWTVVNGLFATGVLAGLGVWFLWSASTARLRRWWERRHPEPVAPEPAPRAITDMDRINADRADRCLLWEIEDAFNRQGHA